MVGDRLQELTYAKMRSEAPKQNGVPYSGVDDGGWAGITDKYWLAALIPDQASRVKIDYRYIDRERRAALPGRFRRPERGEDRGGRRGLDHEPRLRRRQGSASARPLRERAAHPVLLQGGRFRLVRVPDPADLLRARLAEQPAREFRPGDHGLHAVREAAVLPARQQILSLDEQDEAARAEGAGAARAVQGRSRRRCSRR